MRRFKSIFQAQRFVFVIAAASNPFNLGRHLVAAGHYRTLRRSAFASWDGAATICRKSGWEEAATVGT
jgi:putative transposase